MKTTMLRFPTFPTKPQVVLFALLVLTSPAFAATKIWDGGGGDGFWQTGFNWDANTTPAPGDVLVFTNTTRLNNTNNFPAGTSFGGISFNSPAGAFSLFGNSIDLAGNISDNQPVTTETISLPLVLTGNRNVNVSDTASLTIGGAISGGFGLSKSGGGLLTLDGANSYSGTTTIAAGTLSISSDGNLGAVPGGVTPASIVISNGTLRGTANLTINANRGIAVGPVTGAGQGRVDVDSGDTVTYRGIVANNGGIGGLTKGGFGTLVLSAPNTYSGATVVKNGNLNLDFNDGTSPANNVIASSSALTLGGENAGIGTANWAALNVAATATKTQSFAGTTIDIGPAIIRATNANLSLGPLSHNAGAGLVFVTNGNSTINTTTANENGILGGWAVTGNGGVFNNITMGTEFATVDANGDVGPYNGYTVHQTGNLHSYVSNATNLRINGVSAGDVRVQNENAGTVTDLNTINLSVTRAYSLIVGAGNTLRLGRHGGIFKSDNANNITWALGAGTTAGGNGTQNAGTLTAGGAPNTDGEIVFAMNNNTSQSQGSLNVEGRITDNGSGKVTVIKTGPQAMKLRGNNTFSGGMYVLGGRMQLAGSEIGVGNPDGGGSGKIVVFPGSYLFLSGIGTLAGGQAISNLVQIAGNGTQQEPVGAIRFGNGAHIAGNVELIGDARVGGGNLANVNLTGISGKVTGNFAFDLGSVQTINSFFSLFNPANDWTGTTTFNARNNVSENRVHNGASEVIPHGFGKGNVLMNGNTSTGTIIWDLNSFNETINGLESSANNPIGCIIQNGVPATVSTLTVGDNDQSGTFGGILQDGGGTLALTKIAGGKLTLAGPNTYTGNTTVNGGTLALSGEGSIAGSQNIQINGGTLDVSALSTDFTATGTVGVNNGTFVVGPVNAAAATLNVSNGGLTVSLNPAEVNVQATALTTAGPTNLINISGVVNISSYPASFTVIDYAGTIGGVGNNFGLGALPSLVTVGYVSNDIVNTRIVVVLLNGPKPLNWRGGSGPDWDEGITENWLEFKGTPNEAPASFFTGDVVSIDDSGETNRLNLVGVLNPGGITVSNETVNYSFTGDGALTGLGGLAKHGAGALTVANNGLNSFSGGISVNGGSLTLATDNNISGGLSIAAGATAQIGTNGNSGNLPQGNVANEGGLVFNRGGAAYTVGNRIAGNGTVTKSDSSVLTFSGPNNTFTGAVLVAAGTLRVNNGNALGTADGNTTVNSGATLDVNAIQLNTEAVIVSGSGGGGAGAIINGNATAQQNAMGNVTLAGHTTFGGTGRWDIRGGAETLSTGGNAYNLTKVGNNQVSLVGVTVDSALANITVSNGIFAVETDTSGLGNPANTLTVHANGTLQFFNTTTPLDKVFQLFGNGQTNTIQVGSGTDNSMIGPVTLTGSTLFNYGGAFALALNGTVGGSGGLTMRGGGTLTINGAASYAGNTVVAAGTLVLNTVNSGGGMLTNAAGSTVSGRGTNAGPVRINGALLPGGAGVAGSFGAGSLTISNASAAFDLATNDVNNVFPANDAVFATGGLTLQGTNTFTLNPGVVGVLTNSQIITLVQYTGALTGGSNNIRLVFPIGYSFRLLDPATTPNAIQVVVDKSPLIVAWRGGALANRTAWDVFTTTNWVNAGDNSTPVSFTNFDGVVFGDTQNTNFVELIGTLQPGSITANNAAVTYTLGGVGRLTGSAPLTVQGGGTVIVANSGSNDLTGAVNINSGTLQIGNGGAGGNLGSGNITNQGNLVFNRSGALTVNSIHGGGLITNNGSGVVTIGGVNTYEGGLSVNQGTVKAGSGTALGSVAGSTWVANGATLDVGGQVLNLEAVTVSGAGVGGGGAIVNTGGDQLNAMGNVTLEGHTTFGGPARWDIRGGAASLSTGGAAYNLTKIGPGQFSLVGVLVDAALGNIDVQGGTFAAETVTSSLGDVTKTFTVAAGATFQLFNSTVAFDKVFLFTGNGVANTMNVSAGTANSLIGPITITGPCIFNVTGANALSLPGPGFITGTGSLIKSSTGTLNLSTSLEYTGDTTVNGGALIVSGPAALTNSPIVTVNTLLDVTALNNGPTLERLNGQTLMGNGNINGSVNIAAGGTLAPGLSIGVLTVTNNVNLNGTTVMEVQSSPSTNDRLRSITGTINFGGTLAVTNLTPIAGTNTYQLFQGTLAGNFSNIILPNLPGVAWNTANLNVNGTITAVQTVNTTPINLTFALTGSGLDISWPDDHTGWRLEGQTNSVNVGLSNNWVTVTGSAATNRVIMPFNPANGSAFYRLVYP